jgi:HSP20 family protein
MATHLSRRRENPLEMGGIARLNRMLDEALGGWMGMEPSRGGSLTSDWLPPCDITEDDRSIRLQVELPGVQPEDIRLSIEGNLLSIRGEKRQTAEERNERVHRYERSYGAFERTFTLPSSVDTGAIDADVENGILTVTIPKSERAKPREIRLGTGGGGGGSGRERKAERKSDSESPTGGPSQTSDRMPLDRDPAEEGSAGKRRNR